MKYIIFDMDDTLLNNQREISPFTLQTLQSLQSMGHKIVINTARSKQFNQAFFDQLQPDYAILNGGAQILDRDEKEIYKATIDVETTRRVVAELLKITSNFSVQAADGLYTNNPEYTAQNAKHFDFSQAVWSKEALKIIASIADESAAAEIAQTFQLGFTTYLGGTFRRYNHPSATKAQGNRQLVQLLGSTAADIIAFGDDEGDLDMLREAGVGVLMKNARPQFHQHPLVLSQYTNDEDGVARFLLDYFHV